MSLNLFSLKKEKLRGVGLLASFFLSGFFLTLSLFLFFIPSSNSGSTISSDQILEAEELGVNRQLTTSPAPARLPSSTLVLGSSVSRAPPTPTIVSQASPGQDSAPTALPTSMPIPTSTAAPNPTPEVAKSVVNLEISSPEGNSKFFLEYQEEDVCHLLERARDLGYLSSVTIDYSYLKTFRSAYVVEINGYRNNWTFTANGAAPLGCSLYQIQENDSIVWKFL